VCNYGENFITNCHEWSCTVFWKEIPTILMQIQLVNCIYLQKSSSFKNRTPITLNRLQVTLFKCFGLWTVKVRWNEREFK
jgi:hypothetical protein